MKDLVRIACLFCILASLGRFSPAAEGDELIVCGWDEVFILNAAKDISTNKIWSWKASDSPELPPGMRDKFRTTDECKPIEDGQKILIVSSGGGVALVERATKKALFYGFVGNAHSAEILPRQRVAVAGSRHAQGNCVAVFGLDIPEKVLCSTKLDSGHGVVWDEARQILWALGFNQLQAIRLKNWETTQPELEVERVYKLPGQSGHDLGAVPNSSDLLLTTEKNVWLFNRDNRSFRPHPLLGDEPSVKSVSIHPKTGRILYIQAEGENWWAGGLRMLEPSQEWRLPGERLYKVRWFAK